ncbi:MAG: ABC transporter ATP-binding protein [Thermoguttaceae bacterium]|nr:ABC transporter ATP-binding protein [Thermoguttaceae bacterium]MBR6435433.1 ABC transporter ATP-binding protein [Thermoguttaceae bacterium]
MLVEIKNLVRYFPHTKAVNNISFSFDKGQIFGFVGPNGAGKTTTMRILATLDQPQYGDCLVDGYSVTQYPEKVRKLVGFMPDSLPVHNDISVREYVDFYARAYNVQNPTRTRIVNEVMDFTDLHVIADKTLNALSKGMKQRVSLARALVHEPKVLILDEPANGLDPRARVQMRELFKALAENGMAILISSHILTELGEICDGVVFIEKGKLLDAGTISEISQRRSNETLEAEIRLLRSDDWEERLKQLSIRLLEIPNVTNPAVAGDHVELTIEDGEATAAAILRQLINDGFPIVDFRLRNNQLEDLFMTITNGNVQ